MVTGVRVAERLNSELLAVTLGLRQLADVYIHLL